VVAAAGLAWLTACTTLHAPNPREPFTAQTLRELRPEQFTAPIASSAGWAAERERALAQIRRAEEPGADEATVLGALWNVAFQDMAHDAGRRILQRELSAQPLAERRTEAQRALLSAAHMLDPAGSAAAVQAALPTLQRPREFAIAAYTLLRADGGAVMREQLHAALLARTDRDDPRLIALARVLSAEARAADALHQRPPLVDLLAAPFKPGLPVVVSFQRRDRRSIGLAVVRGADGRFVRDAQGELFHIPHLAFALTHLPGTVTNGNTPQGLFTIVGAGSASNRWIGPTPYLYSKVPFEASVSEWEHAPMGPDNSAWSEARYEALLPPSWRAWAPFREAWLAGRAGRDEMLLHGTTIDHRPYGQRPWWPGTPSAGCLVALERWSSEEGRLVQSDQLALVQAFVRDGMDRGYLVVVEVDDRGVPVLLEDVKRDILAAEQRLATAR
jgi:hypothetical protein